MFIIYESQDNNEVFVTTPEREDDFLKEFFGHANSLRSKEDYDRIVSDHTCVTVTSRTRVD